MRPFQVEAPEGVLLSAAELRTALRFDSAEEDTFITALEKAAVSYLDGYTGRLGRCILRQTWALPLDGEIDIVFLPFPDCREFSVKSLGEDGTTWTDVEGVEVKRFRDHVLLKNLPTDTENLHLLCVAGSEDATKVDETIKQIVRLLVVHWFNNRSAVSTGPAPHQVPMAVEALISPLKSVFA